MKVRSGQGRAQGERLRAYGELRRIEQVLPAARAEIIAAADAIVAEAALAEMKTTSIDELKDFGATVGPLQSAGFRKVADLGGHTELSLQRYRGIGEVTAAAALQAYRTFEVSAKARVRQQLVGLRQGHAGAGRPALERAQAERVIGEEEILDGIGHALAGALATRVDEPVRARLMGDRKSTRLNSSH